MNESRAKIVIEADVDNATKAIDQIKDNICNLEKDISALEAALDDFNFYNAVEKLKEIIDLVKKLPSEVSAEVIFGHIGEEIAGPLGKWFCKTFGMMVGSLVQTTPLQEEYLADCLRQVEEAEAKKMVELSGYKAANDFMSTVTPTEPQRMALQKEASGGVLVEDIGLLPSHGPGFTGKLDGVAQTTEQTARDIVVVTEQARDRIATAMHGVTGIFNETFENGITAQAKWIEEQDKAVDAAVKAGSDFANGWRAGLDEYVRDASNTFAQTRRLAQTTAQSMQQSFSDFFFDAMRGRLKGFEDYLNSFVVSVQRAVADMTAQRVTGSLISGFSGLFSAHGNVFDRGQVLRFASGGVVSGPSLFPLGVMGEAGPEAILPLQRTRSGDLGVRVAGSDGGDVVNNYFALNISAVDTRSMAQAFDQHKRQIVGMVQEAYNKRGKKGPVG